MNNRSIDIVIFEWFAWNNLSCAYTLFELMLININYTDLEKHFKW